LCCIEFQQLLQFRQEQQQWQKIGGTNLSVLQRTKALQEHTTAQQHKQQTSSRSNLQQVGCHSARLRLRRRTHRTAPGVQDSSRVWHKCPCWPDSISLPWQHSLAATSHAIIHAQNAFAQAPALRSNGGKACRWQKILNPLALQCMMARLHP